MPRILCFLHSFEPAGVERTALRLSGAWLAAGADVAIALGRDEGALRIEAPDCAIIVPRAPRISTRPFETAWMVAKLPGIVRMWRPDILFCAGNSYTIVAVAMKLLLGPECPPIVAKISNDLSRRDLPAPIRFFYRRWCRIQARHLDHIVTLSPAMREEAVATMRMAPVRVSVIANPVLDRRRRGELAGAGNFARRTRREGRRFLAVGRLVRQKDFALLIRAFATGAGAGDSLVIVGEGPERARLKRLIAKLALAHRVRLAGHSDRIERWIGRSDVLILASRYEGLPGVVVEALAAGLGIIATDCCASMSGLLGRGRFGTLVPSGSEAALAQAIATAKAGQADVGDAAALAAGFDADVAAEAYLALFARLRPEPIAARGTHLDRHAA